MCLLNLVMLLINFACCLSVIGKCHRDRAIVGAGAFALVSPSLVSACGNVLTQTRHVNSNRNATRISIAVENAVP
jgi:hypothetical protein